MMPPGKNLNTEVVVTIGDRQVARHTLRPGEYLIGRDPSCQIVVDAPEVSRRHARLIVAEEGIRLEDLGSTSGTSIGDEPVSGIVELKTPQRVKVGSALIYVALLDSPVSTVEPLRGMSLRNLDLRECVNLSNLSPLADCKELEQLWIPVQCRDVDYLRSLPNLKILSNSDQNTYVDDFWKQHDAPKP